MPEYGVWLESASPSSAEAVLDAAGEAPPADEHESESEPVQFVWRGQADDADAALEAAREAWNERYGSRTAGGRAYTLEIEPGDAGYRDQAG